ncbi:ABC transporter substrate-binding protein [Tardiphaga sp.]|uniref:ABC transporter substrate-binding protein n=1 Tax=Tardiphaga sp. TaxID=1926292 RepID=UPI0037D9CE8D
MRRRDVLGLLTCSALVARWKPAHASPVPALGYLCAETPELFTSRLAAFRAGLQEAGFVEGDNVRIDYAWANGQYDQLPRLAADLASQQVDAIVASGGAQAALAAKAATTTKTIVFEMGGDPVQLGVVDSLSRPGGNITGISSLSVDVSPKRLELMHDMDRDVRTLAVAVNPSSPTAASQLQSMTAAAHKLGIRIHVVQAKTESDFDPLFATLIENAINGLVFTSDPYFAFRSRTIAHLALKYRMPTITQSRDFPIAGGLMSYGGDFTQSHRRAGIYAGRVLNGEQPRDLPVQLVTKVELVINLRTAAELGRVFPPSLAIGADDVVE